MPTISKTNFRIQLTVLLLHAGLVQKRFFVGSGVETFFVGSGVEGGCLLSFWAFKVGDYLRWALIRRWAINQINTVYHILTNMAHKPNHMHVGNINR